MKKEQFSLPSSPSTGEYTENAMRQNNSETYFISSGMIRTDDERKEKLNI